MKSPSAASPCSCRPLEDLRMEGAQDIFLRTEAPVKGSAVHARPFCDFTNGYHAELFLFHELQESPGQTLADPVLVQIFSSHKKRHLLFTVANIISHRNYLENSDKCRYD